MDFELDDDGKLGRLAVSLANAGLKAGAKAFVLTRKYGITLQSRVKANAAGRPGPRMITGDYNRSIGLTMRQRGASSEATVGTNKPQGPRLEYGFVGEDSRGRSYSQPPYEHFGPAGEKTAPEFTEAAAELAAEIVGDAVKGA